MAIAHLSILRVERDPRLTNLAEQPPLPQATLEANVEALDKWWLTSIPASAVKMNGWECGTYACLGGWMGRTNQFGVVMHAPFRESSGSMLVPSLELETPSGSRWLTDFHVAGYLFGDMSLFYACADSDTSQGQSWTDHQKVSGRIDRTLEWLKRTSPKDWSRHVFDRTSNFQGTVAEAEAEDALYERMKGRVPQCPK